MKGPVELGAIAIGRNEGERLKRCLGSLRENAEKIVFVDSGSTDGSAEFARSIGVDVVELDMSQPFSMARARNAGANRLRELMPGIQYLLFVDGDCGVAAGWIPAALDFLEHHPETVAVCGRRRERSPKNSIYNALCDVEWNTPVGPAKACGGDALMRAKAFFEVGGFNEALIAGEEPELCLRLRQAGGQLHRLDAEMTLHDANILRFNQWWKRNVRGGYGAADVVRRLQGKVPDEDIPFLSLVRGAPVWSLYWAAATLLITLIHPLLIFVGLAVWCAQALRIARGVRQRADSRKTALAYGVFTLIGKWAQLWGILRYRRDVRQQKLITLIEYK